MQALLPAVVQLNANQFGALLSWADSQAAVGCSAVQRSDTIARLNAGHEPDTVMRDTLLLSPRQIHWSAARRARVPDFFLQPSNDMAFPACRPGADEL